MCVASLCARSTIGAMAAGEEPDLEALAAMFADIAAGVPEELGEEEESEEHGMDIAACLVALGQAPSGVVHGQAPPAEQEEPHFENPRARNAWRARQALARKRQRLMEAKAAPIVSHSNAAASSALALPQEGRPLPHVRVPSGVLDSIRSGIAPTFAGPHLQAALHACLRLADAQRMPTDEVVGQLVQFACVESEGRVETTIAVAEKLGIDRGRVDRLMPASCSCLVNMEQLLQRRVELAMSGVALQKLVFVDGSRYDETPMETRTADVSHAIVAKPVLVGKERKGKKTLRPSVRRTVLASDTGASKLFQTEAAYGMLCKVDTSGAGGSKLVGIIGRPATWIQQLEQNSAELYKRALVQVCKATTASLSHDLPVRLAASDKNAANVKAEKGLVRDRSNPWLGFSFFCDIHTAAGCHTKTAKLVESDIKGLLNISLSVLLTGNMRRFRRCMRADIVSRLSLLHGRPPARAEEYRQHALELFLSRGPDYLFKRSLIQVYLPGDWTNHDEIEFYYHSPDAEGLMDEQDLRETIADGVVRCLANHSLRRYRRDRWVGFDLAIDQLGLLEAAHGILRHAFQWFCAELAPHPMRAEVPFGVRAAIEGSVRAPDAQDPSELVGLDEAPGLVGSSASELADRNSRFRKVGLEYLNTEPLGNIMIVRKVFEPFRVLLSTLINIGGESWQTEQLAQEARHILDGAGSTRKHRIQVAAKHELENEFNAGLHKALFGPSAWRHLPMTSKTKETRSLVFRLLSRAGCTVECLLRLPHDIFPTRLWLALEDDAIGEMLSQSPPCEFDSFSRAFVSKSGLVGEDARAALGFLAHMIYLDIGSIEQRHAPLRRRTKAMAPTNVPSASDVSAFWTLRRYRLMKQRYSSKEPPAEKAKVKKRIIKATGKAKFAGGAWRAWVRKKTKGSGQKADFRALAVAYHALDPQERAELVRIGRAATLAGASKMQGQSSFGPTTRQAKRIAEGKFRQERIRRRLLGNIDMSGLTTMAEALAITGCNVHKIDELSRIARGEARQVAAAKRSEQYGHKRMLERYHSEVGERLVGEVVSAIPTLAGLPAQLRATPERCFDCFEVASATEGDVAKIVSYGAQHGKRSNVLQALRLDWDQKVQTISGEGLPPLTFDGSRDEGRRDRCRSFGVCICSGEGRVVMSMANSFLRHFKPVVKFGTPEREHLLNGLLVVQLHWSPSCTPVDGKGAAAVVGNNKEALDSYDIFWHVGWISLSPYLPSFQVLEARDGRAALAAQNRPFELRATGGFLPFYRAIDSLERDGGTWEMTFLKIRDNPTPIADFDPSVVEAESMTPHAKCFWKPRGRGNGRGRGGRAGASQSRGRGERAADQACQEPEPGMLEDGDASSEEDPLAAEGEDHACESEEVAEEAAAIDIELEFEAMLIGLLDDEAAAAESAAAEEEALGEAQGAPPGVGLVPALPADAAAQSGGGHPASMASASSTEVGKKSISIRVGDGTLKYFHRIKRFEATCGNKACHGRCVLTRSAREGTSGKSGTPLGFMSWWLNNNQATQAEHVFSPLPSLAEREAARAEFMAFPGADAFAAEERLLLSGEPTEPMVCD